MMKSNIIFCTNCGEVGHYTKQCMKPVTSFGVIVFRVKGGWNQAENLTSSSLCVNGFTPESKIEFLLIVCAHLTTVQGTKYSVKE